jgi:thiamine biosynthesis protein ThiS
LIVIVNGEAKEVGESIALSELIASLDLNPERLAVEVNRRIIRRGEWGKNILSEGDRVEIVHFVGGGDRLLS